jgi:hypothetical protein
MLSQEKGKNILTFNSISTIILSLKNQAGSDSTILNARGCWEHFR